MDSFCHESVSGTQVELLDGHNSVRNVAQILLPTVSMVAESSRPTGRYDRNSKRRHFDVTIGLGGIAR